MELGDLLVDEIDVTYVALRGIQECVDSNHAGVVKPLKSVVL